MGQGLAVLRVLCSEYLLPILSVGEYPLARQVKAVSLIPRFRAFDATLQEVAVVGGTDFSSGEVECGVCHSECLLFRSFCIYYTTKSSKRQ